MSVMRFSAIILIFVAASVGWSVLGGTIQMRTDDLDESLSAEMAGLWGPKVVTQPSPYWTPRAQARWGGPGVIAPNSSVITADVAHEHRYKGLLWYSTFTVDFAGQYAIPPAGPREQTDANGTFVFDLPQRAKMSQLSVSVDGQPHAISLAEIALRQIAVPMARDAEHTVEVRYRTGGQDAWLYSPAGVPETVHKGDKLVVPAEGPLNQLSKFSLVANTDFRDIDYPSGALSPTKRATPMAGGMQAAWEYPNLITSQCIGIAMPKRLNAGPIAARMSFFAPVSLFFFFTVLFTIVVLKGIRLHPMHYLFIAGGFFAFHILMAYLADVISIQPAFWISAAVSVFLVVSYMRLAAGVRFALTYTAIAQAVFLVGFSYAFFWAGRTGLTVTICAVVTLFVLMQATGRVNWHEVFRRPHRSAAPPPNPPGPPITLDPFPTPGPESAIT